MPASETRELNPTNLQDPIDQNLMLMFLRFGELQLTINEKINESNNAKYAFFTKNRNNYLVNFFFLKIRQRIVRKSLNRINSIYRNLTTLQILMINRRALGEQGTEILDLCNYFLKLLNSNRQITDAFFKRLDALFVETEKLKKDLQKKQQFELVDYTHLIAEESYPLPLENSAASHDYAQVKIIDHSLLLRHRGNGKKGVVYEVWRPSQKPVGQGSFATVVKLLSKIKKSFGKASYSEYGRDTKSEYVLKQSHSNALCYSDGVIEEAKILTSAVHTHSKPFRVEEQRYHFVMQYFSGDLYELLGNLKNVSTNFHFDLILKILQTYKLQIYDQKIIHCDIKPENICVKIKQTSAGMRVEEINFIDFNISQLVANPKPIKVGTPGYYPPERLLEGNPTTAFDIYSLVIVMIEIITEMCPDKNKKAEFYELFNLIRQYSMDLRFIAKFQIIQQNLLNITEDMLKLSGVPAGPKDDLLKLIKNMLDSVPQGRPSIEMVIDKIERIENNFHKSQNKRSKIIGKAQNTRQALAQIQQKPTVFPVVLIIPQQQDINNSSKKPLEELKNIILEGCKEINEEQDLHLFLAKLGVKALEECVTYEAIEKTIDEIITNFRETMSSLLDLYARLADIEKYKSQIPNFDWARFKELKIEIEEVIDKHKKYTLSLDNLVALSSRLEKRLPKLSENVNECVTEFSKYKSEINEQFEDFPGETEEPKVSIFKGNIRDAIEQYESESDTRFNHLFHRRAFSSTRKKQIEDLRRIVDSYNNLDTLISEVTEITKNIDSGSFPNSKSILKENLEYVLFDYPQVNRPAN